ncbi:glycosyltransferase family 1 protein [Salipaludibacillus sp. HK11]|uniref:glycosyltransferase family 1 protein n=1 Tax=Salipaludibacillus sp. HK11 TaxID=3394320 RepID=UPI0039FCB499
MGNPIKILHVVVNMNRGGAEAFIMNLYRNIDRTKVQFDFLTFKEGVYDDEIRKLGGVVHRIPYVTEVGPQKYQKLLEAFFMKHSNYKIVHSHMDKMSGLILSCAKKYDIPIRIAHSHNTSSEGNKVIQLFKWYNGKKIKQSATDCFACSEQAGSWLFESEGLSYQLINNGIDIKDYQYNENIREQTRKEFGVTKKQFLIGQIGRFNRQKNHSFTIELFSKFIKDQQNAKLVLVGDGLLRKNTENLVERYGLNDLVTFTGVRDDISDLLSAFDVLLFPSFHEGMPVALIEAQASGLHCLASDAITTDVDLELGLVHFLDLNDKQRWTRGLSVISRKIATRYISSYLIEGKGFDIMNTATWIQQFYLNKVGSELINEKDNNFYSHL